MKTSAFVLSLLLVAACGGGDDDDDNDDVGAADGSPNSPDGQPGEPDGSVQLSCAAPAATQCGNNAARIRGHVRMASSLTPDSTSGNLVIGLAHYRLGSGSTGGVYHTHTVVNGVDLAAGATREFSLDMCTGGAMWSEDNCEYRLIAILDQNGNNEAGGNMIPDPGEPVGVIPIELSCTGESPCVDLVLDCMGASCAAFTDPGACTCATQGCGSDFVTCQ